MILELDGDMVKILVAIFVGGLIGIEREYRDKAAGFRTNILICLGATLFMMFSQKLGTGAEDPVRIAAQIVSGIGFLGAGAIVKDGKFIQGLTTAATIWFTAALGMGIGGGFFELVLLATFVALIILWVFPVIEHWIDNHREMRTYEISYDFNPDKAKSLESLFKNYQLKLYDFKQFKRDGLTISQWTVYGHPAQHDQFVEKLFSDSEIKSFTY